MDRSRTHVLIVLVAIGVWATVTPFMWRDLRHRTSGQVRGPKWLWWVASANLSGSAAYWLLGRRPADRVPVPVPVPTEG
jgi:hypothetical protein